MIKITIKNNCFTSHGAGPISWVAGGIRYGITNIRKPLFQVGIHFDILGFKAFSVIIYSDLSLIVVEDCHLFLHGAPLILINYVLKKKFDNLFQKPLLFSGVIEGSIWLFVRAALSSSDVPKIQSRSETSKPIFLQDNSKSRAR